MKKRKRRMSEKLVDDNFQLRRKVYTNEHPNPMFDDADTEDDENTPWQNNPYYFSGQKYELKHNAYVYKGRNK